MHLVGLLAVLGVDEDGDGAVVDEGDLHVGAELSGLYLSAEELGEAADEALVHGHGDVGLGGTDVAGAVAFLGAGHEGELADEEDAAAGDFGDGEVHDAVGIVEDAEGDDFAAEPVDVVVGVGVFDAEEYHHAGAYLAFYLASDGDGGGEATLDYYAHFFN